MMIVFGNEFSFFFNYLIVLRFRWFVGLFNNKMLGLLINECVIVVWWVFFFENCFGLDNGLSLILFNVVFILYWFLFWFLCRFLWIKFLMFLYVERFGFCGR